MTPFAAADDVFSRAIALTWEQWTFMLLTWIAVGAAVWGIFRTWMEEQRRALAHRRVQLEERQRQITAKADALEEEKQRVTRMLVGFFRSLNLREDASLALLYDDKGGVRAIPPTTRLNSALRSLAEQAEVRIPRRRLRGFADEER